MERNNQEKEIDYDIEFVDPNELVDFISENSDIESPKSNPPQAATLETEDEEFDEDQDLKYTDLLKETSNDYIKKRREDTRGRLAVVYTIFTFLMFLVVIFVGVLDGLVRQVSIVQNLSTLLPLVSGIFLGTLGFVLGYYFKREDRP